MTSTADSQVVRVVASALERICIDKLPHRMRSKLDIQDLKSVPRLSDLTLTVGRGYCRDDDMGVGLHLLRNCPGVEHVDILLQHSASGVFYNLGPGPRYVGHFANVKSMTVEAPLSPRRHLVASISLLLLRFPCLRSLHIKFTDTGAL